MDEIKKRKSAKAGTVTRRIKELQNTIKVGADKLEITDHGLSFNDALFKGKLEMTDIMEIITQFRCGEIAITGDVRKMLSQILLDKTAEQYHGIVYKGQTYVFTRVSFGGTSSPNIAEACMMHIAASGERTHPAQVLSRIKDM